MRRVLGVLLAPVLVPVLLVLGGSAPTAADPLTLPLPGSPLGDPVGANDWSCRPTAQRPTPVVIVHGTFGDRRSLLDPLSASLAGAGFCVYALDYGNRATADIRASARELGRFVTRVRDATGAAKVSLVGHSQGGMMPRYYIRFLGGGRYVEDLVGLSPSNHGTAIIPSTSLASLGGVCVACRQQAAGSPFLARLNRGDETPGPVAYTQITTRYDGIVVPYLSAYLTPGPRTTNVTVQDLCPGDHSEHGLIAMSPTAIAVTLDALTRPGPADPAYRPACAPGYGAGAGAR